MFEVGFFMLIDRTWILGRSLLSNAYDLVATSLKFGGQLLNLGTESRQIILYRSELYLERN